VIHT